MEKSGDGEYGCIFLPFFLFYFWISPHGRYPGWVDFSFWKPGIFIVTREICV